MDTKRYSEDLRFLIDKMLKTVPAERFSTEQVREYCQRKLQELEMRPKIDCELIMDDIIEKLRLMNYETEFCSRMNRPAISRTYFARSDFEKNGPSKFQNFFDICYWLMSYSEVK